MSKRLSLLLLATSAMTAPTAAQAGTVTSGPATISLAQDGDCGLGSSVSVFRVSAPTRASYPWALFGEWSGNRIVFRQNVSPYGTAVTAKSGNSPADLAIPTLGFASLAAVYAWVSYADTALSSSSVSYDTAHFDPSQVDPSCPGYGNLGPAPVIDVTPAGALPNDGVIQITTNERLVGLEASDLLLTGGTVTGLVQNDTLGHSFSVTIAPSASTVQLTLPAGAAKDVTGNNSPQVTRTYSATVADTTPPLGYTVSFDDAVLNAGEIGAASFTIAGAEVGSSYDYAIFSTGGGISVTGSGTVTAATQTVGGIDLNSLGNGTLTLSLTLTDAAGNAGSAVTANATLDRTPPSGYSASFPDTYVNASEATSTSFVMAGAEVGATYSYSFTTLNTYTASTGSLPGSAGATVTGSGTVTAADQTVGGIDISSLGDGQLRVVLTLTDAAGNVGEAVYSGGAPAFKDATPPASTAYFPYEYYNSANIGYLQPGILEATVGLNYSYSLTSTGGGTPQSGSGTLTNAMMSGSSALLPGVNVAAMADGTLTLEIQATDAAGNGPITSVATTIKDTVAPTPSVQWTKTQYNADDVATAGLRFTNVEAGDTYNWRINGTAVSGTGTFSSSDEVVYIDLTGFADGDIWVTSSVTDPQFNKSADIARPTQKDTVGPAPTVAFPSSTIAWESRDAVTLTAPFNCEVNRGCNYELSITSTGGGTPVTATGFKFWNDSNSDIGPLDLSGLGAGTLTATLKVTDTEGNHTTVETTATLAGDAVAPSGYSAAFDKAVFNAADAASASVTMAGAEVGATYAYSITSNGGGTPVTGGGTVSAAGEQITGLDLTGLGDGTVTFELVLTDAAGNAGTAATAMAQKDATAPSGYDGGFPSYINATNVTAGGIVVISTDDVGAQIDWSVASSGGGTPLTGVGVRSGATTTLTGIDFSSLPDGELTLSLRLTDLAGNVGPTVVATSRGYKDIIAPLASLDIPVHAGNQVSAQLNVDAGQLVYVNYRVTSSVHGTLANVVNQAFTDTNPFSTDLVVDVTGKQQGTLTFNVDVWDEHGNHASFLSQSYTFDEVAPSGYAVSFVDPLISAAEAGYAGFNLTGAEVGATYAWTISSSGGGSISGGGPVTSASQLFEGIDLNSLGEGELTLSLTLTDAAGNAGTAATAMGTLDRTLWPASYTPVPIDGGNVTAYTLALSGLEIGATYRVSVRNQADGTLTDGSDFVATATEMASPALDTSAVSDGAVWAIVSVTDAAGNGVSTYAPTTKDVGAPAGYAVTLGADSYDEATLSSASFEMTGAEVGASFAYEISSSGGGTPVTGSGSVTSTTQTVGGIDLSGLADGTLTIALALTDAAGNEGLAVTDTATLQRDTTAPAGYAIAFADTLLNASEVGSVTLNLTGAEIGADFAFEITSAGGGTPVTGTGTVASASQAITGLDLTDLGDGTLSVSIVLTDDAGNAGVEATGNATKDTLAPSGYRFGDMSGIINGANVAAYPVEIVFGADAGGLTAEVEMISAFGGTASATYPVSGGFDVTPFDASALADGAATLRFRLTDAAGNVGEWASFELTKDTVAPVFGASGLAVSAGVLGGTLTLDDLYSGEISYSVTSSGGGAPVTGILPMSVSQSLSIDVSLLPSGTFTLALEATDAAFNKGTASFEVEGDTAAPAGYAIAFADPLIGDAEAGNVALDLNGLEVGADYLVTIISAGGGSPVTRSGTVTATSDTLVGFGLAGLGDGMLTVKLVLTDAAGNVGSEASGTAMKDTAAPVVTAGGFDTDPVTAANAGAASLSFSGGTSGDTYQVAIVSDGGGSKMLSGTLSGSTTTLSGIDLTGLGDGTLTATVTLADAAGNAATPFDFDVLKDTLAPSGYGFGPLDPVATANASAYALPLQGLEVGATLHYLVTSDGGGSTSGSFVAAAASDSLSLDLTGLGDGAITAKIWQVDAAGNTGAQASVSTTKDSAAPSGYGAAFDQAAITAANASAGSFTFSLAEVGSDFVYSITSSTGGTPVSGSGTIVAADQQVAGLDLTGLGDGTLTLSVTLTDTLGNAGSPQTATVTKDTAAPSGHTVASVYPVISQANAAAMEVAITGGEDGAGYELEISSTGGPVVVTRTGTLSGADVILAGNDVSGLADGTLTLSLTIIDEVGNRSAAATATVVKDTAQATGFFTVPLEAGIAAFDVAVQFSEEVTGLAASDFVVANATASLAGSGAAYVLTLTPSGSGDVTLELPAGTARDLAGNPVAGIAMVSIGIDAVVPEPVVGTAPASVNGPFKLPISFGEAVTGLEASDFIVENATIELTGGPADWILIVTPTGEGDISIRLPEGAATDAAGNPTKAFAADIAVAFDDVAPTVTLSAEPGRIIGPFDLSIAFSEDVSGLELGDFLLDNATLSNLREVDAAHYLVTVKPTAMGSFSVAVAAGAVVDEAGNENEASDAFEGQFIDEDKVRKETVEKVSTFMARRADQIMAADPDLGAFLRDGDAAGSLQASGNGGNVRLAYNGHFSLADLGVKLGGDTAKRLTLWLQGSLVHVDGSGDNSDMFIGYAGAHYRLSKDAVVGVMGQVDQASQDIETQAVALDGSGWMVGPYFAARVGKGVTFDGRAAWGGSDNGIVFESHPAGEAFQTHRSLYRIGVSGDLDLSSSWTLRPQARLLRYRETSDPYTDTLGVAIPEVGVEIGRLAFGPQIERRFAPAEGSWGFAPRLGIDGLWDFSSKRWADGVPGIGQSTDDFRARIKVGGTLGTRDLGLDFDAFYDGIGASSFDAYGVSLRLRKSM
ncbi:Ig-like domain-containing protein [Sphingomicrobium nitratireducens]|uniref:Ig-like domain-containing protein n=1 Tax=Sphingomicrobium nitratireducens TaxID=2964666 RepID=UPI00223FDADB|nr:Ig-like domain-containing protein [Sphingomicrobium nitratireducens]